MGIPKQVVKLLQSENAYKQISGEALVCGRQTVLLDQESIEEIFTPYPDILGNLLSQWKDPANLDKSTRHGEGSLRDDVFLRTFLNINYNCIDLSDYEGANIIFDLNNTVPEDLQSRFDFIYSGGCLDNIFNPVSLLTNISKMLKPGGRVVHYESFSGVMGTYLLFSPEWFFSYYAINNFSDCKVYVCHQTRPGVTRFGYFTNLFLYQPYFTRSLEPDYFKFAMASAGILYVLIIAEKSTESSDDKFPIQLQYLDEKCEDWRVASKRFNMSARPLLSSINKEDSVVKPFLSDHYHYLGSYY